MGLRLEYVGRRYAKMAVIFFSRSNDWCQSLDDYLSATDTNGRSCYDLSRCFKFLELTFTKRKTGDKISRKKLLIHEKSNCFYFLDDLKQLILDTDPAAIKKVCEFKVAVPGSTHYYWLEICPITPSLFRCPYSPRNLLRRYSELGAICIENRQWIQNAIRLKRRGFSILFSPFLNDGECHPFHCIPFSCFPLCSASAVNSKKLKT